MTHQFKSFKHCHGNSKGCLIVAVLFTEIKTGYQGFETIQNRVFCMLVLCSENR